MSRHQINHFCEKALTALPVISLLAVGSGYLRPPQADEGAAAHIFQLSVAALLPVSLLFAATADWSRRWRSARPLAVPAVVLALSFGALYYLEHLR